MGDLAKGGLRVSLGLWLRWPHGLAPLGATKQTSASSTSQASVFFYFDGVISLANPWTYPGCQNKAGRR